MKRATNAEGRARGRALRDSRRRAVRRGPSSSIPLLLALLLPVAGGSDAEPGMCFDRARGRAVLFGGWTRSGGPMSGATWEWDGREPRAVSTSGPGARAGHVLVFDPVRGACLLFGGTGPDGEDLGDTWVWDGTSWSRIAGEGPPARGMPRMAFDGSAIVLFGGRSRGEDGFFDRADTWILDGDEWRRATPEPTRGELRPRAGRLVPRRLEFPRERESLIRDPSGPTTDAGGER